MISKPSITYSTLAKLYDGLDESPTVMVRDKKQQTKKLGKNRGIRKPSWAFVETIKINHTHCVWLLQQIGLIKLN